MWLRRMNAVSSTQLPAAVTATVGFGTREVPAPAGASARAGAATATSAKQRHPAPAHASLPWNVRGTWCYSPSPIWM